MKVAFACGLLLSSLAGTPAWLERGLPGEKAEQATAQVRTTTFQVSVSSATKSGLLASVSDPDVLDVQATLGPSLLELSDPSRAPAVVSSRLEGMYPGLVSQSGQLLAYAWVWNPYTREWELRCTSHITYLVALATTVAVDVDVLVDLSD